MKTIIRFSKMAVIPFIALLALAGCGKSDTSSTTTTSQYVLTSGGCYDSTNSQYVASTLCTTTATTGYYLQNGYCYSSTTGAQVLTALCSSTTTSTTGTLYQVCTGPYLYSNGSSVQQVTCYGANCRGYIMYTVSTHQPVVCQ